MIENWFLTKKKHSSPHTLPKTNIFAPENAWLEDKPLSFSVSASFQGHLL